MATKPSSLHPNVNPNPTDSGRAAFVATKPQRDALAPDEVMIVNANIPAAVTIALAAAPRIESLIPQMLRLGLFDVENARTLRTRAMAAWYADAIATGTSQDELAPLLEEAVPLKRRMLVASEALADAGYFPAERVAEIRAGTGHHDTATDMIAFSQLFDTRWDVIRDKTAITRTEVDRAAELGTGILNALVQRKQVSEGNGTSDQQQEDRARAFTLLYRAYNQCRRVVAFLRFDEGDADLYAPSLYAQKRRRSSVEDTETTEPTPPAEPPTLVEPAPIVPETPVMG